MTLASPPRKFSGSHRIDPSWPMLFYAAAVAVSPEFDFLGFEKVRVSDLLLPMLLLVFVGARATEGYKARRRRVSAPIPLLAPMALLLAWDAAAYFLFSEQGPLTRGGMYLLKRTEFFVVYFLGVVVVTSEWSWLRIIRVFSLAAPFLNLSVLWELYSNPQLHRASGVIKGQETSTALFIIVLLGLVLGALPHIRGPYERISLMLGALTGAAALLATGSRAGLICAGVLVMAEAMRARKRRIPILAALIFLVLPAWLLMPETVQERFEGTGMEFNQAWAGLVSNPEDLPSAGSSSLVARLLVARHVVTEVIPRNPIFGLGTGRLGLGIIDNMYLCELVYHGLVGLGLFVVLLWSMGRTLQSISRQAKDPLLKSMAGSLFSVLVTLVLSGLVAETFYLIRPMEAYLLLVGLVVGRARLRESEY
jgi:hypothetical protein